MMSNKQIENDLDKQFAEKLVSAMQHLREMYQIAGLPPHHAAATAASECLRFAIYLVVKCSHIPRDEFLKVCGDIFERNRELEGKNG